MSSLLLLIVAAFCLYPASVPAEPRIVPEEMARHDEVHDFVVAFTEPDITMGQMIEKVPGFMTKMMNMPESQANAMAGEFIPKLKRWR
jgi:hypothetical protein